MFWWNYWEFSNKMSLTIRTRMFNKVKYCDVIFLKIGDHVRAWIESQCQLCNQAKSTFIFTFSAFVVAFIIWHILRTSLSHKETLLVKEIVDFAIQSLVFQNIVIRNGKLVWKHGLYCWYFRLNVKYLELLYRAYIIWAKNVHFYVELPSGNDFETVLVTFCCYDHGVKASNVVQKIATDQKECRKCSSCVIICWIATIYLPINNWFLGHLRPKLKKLLKLYKKRAITGPLWVLSMMEVR